jgi:Ca2+-binding EF-hand superfamily protein
MPFDIFDRDSVVESCLNKLKLQLFARGARNLSGLARAFKIADFNGNKKLDVEEFEECLGYAGIFLKKPEITAMFAHFDKTGEGNVDYDEFLLALHGEMNDRRKALVEKAFSILDKDGSGVLTVSDLKGVYNTKKHPDVLAAKKTEDEVLAEFLDGFEGRFGNDDGTVTMKEFTEYYADLSASIPSDEYFVEMMESTWMMTEKAYSAAEDEKLEHVMTALRDRIRTRSRPGSNPAMELRGAFKFFDSDETGHLTIDEFRQALERMGIPMHRRDVGALFARYDTDGSGTLTYDEFVAQVYDPTRTASEAF